MTADELISKIDRARWATAARTYGNDHSTLIRLLVDWWVSLAPGDHTAIESGPTNGFSKPGERGQCDALFCCGGAPVGVLEVEGSRKLETVRKLARFFDGKYAEITGLEFGILLLYAYEPVGKGELRAFDTAVPKSALAEILRATSRHKGRGILLISLEKSYERIRQGIRSKNEYYMGAPSLIEARAFVNGEEKGRRVLHRQLAS